MTEATESNDRARAIADRKIALLIDADNVSHAKIAAMLAELSKYGTANIRRAYGNWASDSLKGWKDKLHDFAIRPIQQFNYSTGKNATDIALVIDAMELLYTQKLDAFCLASSDADFTPLVMQLRANGHEVYGFGERKTPSPFVNACTTFLYLDNLDGADIPAAPSEPPGSKPPKAKDSAKAATPPAKATNKKLAQDTKLVTILRGAVEASLRYHGGKERPIEADRGHQVQVDLLLPRVVADRLIAASRRLGASQHMDNDIETAEPFSHGPNHGSATGCRGQVGRHELHLRQRLRPVPCAGEDMRAQPLEQRHGRCAGTAGARGDKGALPFQGDEILHGTISRWAILSPSMTK